MQLSTLTKKIVLISLFSSSVSANTIGDIFELTGNSALTRNQQNIDTFVSQEILLYDLLNTGNGRLAVQFLDESNLR